MSTTAAFAPGPGTPNGQSPRLLDQVAQAALERGATESTAGQFVARVRALVVFHGKRHPRELGRAAVSSFLEHVVSTEQPPLSALEMARSALELLYGTVRISYPSSRRYVVKQRPRNTRVFSFLLLPYSRFFLHG
jgi:hypothetical protein